MRYAAKRPHVKCMAVAPENDERDTLLALLDDVFRQNPLAICLCVDDPEIARAAAERIDNRGLLLVTVGQRIEGISTYGHVEVNLPQAAELLGKNLGAIAEGRLSYVLLHENGRDRIASRCHARFTTAARSSSTLIQLDERNAADSDRDQKALMQEMIGRFPRVGLVITLNPEPWLSRAPRYRLPDNKRFATLAASPRLWPRLQSGEAAGLVGPLDGEIGYAAVDVAVDGLMRIPSARTLRTIRCELVTLETLPDFARRYAAAAGLEVADLMPIGNRPEPTSQPGGN